jgi:hypothetical protein
MTQIKALYLKQIDNIIFIIFSIIIFSCTNNVVHIKNENQGKMKSSYGLVIKSEKKFLLDYNTAPKPPYIQLIEDSGKRILSFYNPYKNAIYFFDYETTDYYKNISYNKEGSNAILRIGAYFAVTPDSIYILDSPLMRIALSNGLGIIKQRHPLIPTYDPQSRDFSWALYYPQYNIQTYSPVIKYHDKLFLTGFAPFAVADSIIDKFHFVTCFDINDHKVNYFHTYPTELYGDNVSWNSPIYTQVYTEITSNGDFIISFPVSHNLYVAKWDEEKYKTIYGGSNNAKTITSINCEFGTPTDNMLIDNYFKNDLYLAILFDPWRKVYYRFYSKRKPEATTQTSTKEKEYGVIIMDENFQYLGETIIGDERTWNFANSFVTFEGLNIEYMDFSEDSEEEFLRFKIFILKQL